MKSIKFTSLAGSLLLSFVFLTTLQSLSQAKLARVKAFAPAQQDSPKIINAKMKGSKIIILGENFRPETVVLINGQAVKTIVDSESPSTIVVAKKIHKVTTMGVEVTLQTQNSTGGTSEPFDFFVGKTILIDDAEKTITLTVGERVMLLLQKDNYLWTPSVEDAAILQKVSISTAIKGQGIFEAKQIGKTTLSAIGDLPCSLLSPPCAAPSIGFRVHIVVQ